MHTYDHKKLYKWRVTVYGGKSVNFQIGEGRNGKIGFVNVTRRVWNLGIGHKNAYNCSLNYYFSYLTTYYYTLAVIYYIQIYSLQITMIKISYKYVSTEHIITI